MLSLPQSELLLVLGLYLSSWLFLPTDNGNAKSYYEIKGLGDKELYNIYFADINNQQQINNNQQSSIPEKSNKGICKTEALPPRLYGLPKMPNWRHFNDSELWSPNYVLRKYLTSFLPHKMNTEHFVKDLTHFIIKIQGSKLDPDVILLSFDVVSLKTKVLVKDILEIIGTSFPADIIKLFKICLAVNMQLNRLQYSSLLDSLQTTLKVSLVRSSSIRRLDNCSKHNFITFLKTYLVSITW